MSTEPTKVESSREETLGDDEFMAAVDATIRPIAEGELVKGTVVRIDPEEVLVDIGFKSEGVIPARELSIRNDVDPDNEVKVGQEIEALVLQMEDKEGRLILSKKRAAYEKAWEDIEKVKDTGSLVTGRVIEVVKGGLIVDVGLRGFLPASLVDLRRVRDLQPLVGQEIECKIIELDRNRNNVVLSRRAVLEEEHSEQRKDLLDTLTPGEKRTGKVSSIVNYGAFVDLGGLDGLVHISQLSWRHVEHPNEVVNVGDDIEVEVLDVDQERERVSLSLKNTQEDPWEVFARDKDSGDVVKGAITKIVPFGVFVKVADGIEGLVHISELSEAHVESPEEVVAVGDEVRIRVLDIDVERHRISLSIKQADEVEVTSFTSTPPSPAPSVDVEPEQEMELEVEVPSAPEVDVEIEPAPVTAGEEVASEAPKEPAAEPEEPKEPAAGPEQPEKAPIEGELLEEKSEESEESLENIVEEMRKDRSESE